MENLDEVINCVIPTEMLEKNNLFFTGPGSFSLNLATDKVKAKELFIKNNIPTPKFLKCESEEKFQKEILPLKNNFPLQYPVFLKPANLDASYGID